jgi:hypothetical protein
LFPCYNSDDGLNTKAADFNGCLRSYIILTKLIKPKCLAYTLEVLGFPKLFIGFPQALQKNAEIVSSVNHPTFGMIPLSLTINVYIQERESVNMSHMEVKQL